MKSDRCRECCLRGDFARCESSDCKEHQNWYVLALKQKLEEKDTIILTLIILSSSLRRACGAGKELSKLYGEVMNELNYKEAGGEEAD